MVLFLSKTRAFCRWKGSKEKKKKKKKTHRLTCFFGFSITQILINSLSGLRLSPHQHKASHHGHLFFSVPAIVLVLSLLCLWLRAPWGLPPNLHALWRVCCLFENKPKPPALQDWIPFPTSQELDEWYHVVVFFLLKIFHGFPFGFVPLLTWAVCLCCLLTCSDVGSANGAVLGICRS